MNNPKSLFRVSTDGTITAIYSDDLAELIEGGDATITRASHVEPTADGRWTADMSPVNGPLLGPFRLRQEALDAEVAWLQSRLFGVTELECPNCRADASFFTHDEEGLMFCTSCGHEF